MKTNKICKVFIKKITSSHSIISTNKSVRQYINDKISDMQSGKFLYHGHRYAENSILNWIKLSNLWSNFEKTYKKENIKFDDISLNIYFMFLSFCDDKGYSESTKHLYASIFKSAMNYAYEDQISSNQIFKNKKFIICKPVDTSGIFLTIEEIERIARSDLGGFPKLDDVRDIFLTGCYTGQRFSDYSQITALNIISISNGNKKYKVFKVRQQKTGKTVFIPIMDKRVLKILAKRGGELPKVSIRDVNKAIKKICKMAGIDNNVALIRNKGGKSIRVIAPKYEFVSTHTARRSCITNLYLSGKLNLGQIRSISGHSSEASLNKYLCQSKEEQAIEVIRALSSKSDKVRQQSYRSNMADSKIRSMPPAAGNSSSNVLSNMFCNSQDVTSIGL